MPKILKLNKNLTEGSINQNNKTTNASEHLPTRESSEFMIMKNKIENFCHPKIRNQYYYNLKSLDNVFKTKRIMLKIVSKLFLIL